MSNLDNQYSIDERVPKCINLNKINNYGHYEFKIYRSSSLVDLFWSYKEKNALKYVKLNNDGSVTISVSKEQLYSFIEMLIELNIEFSKSDIIGNIYFDNKSNLELIDYTTLDTPFEPYEFQIEDAKEIIKHKRYLIGHEMGCGKTFISILVGESINMPKLVICPASLRLNWKKEIERINNRADVIILNSNEEFKYAKDWTIIGHNTATKYLKEIKEIFKCVFIDEAHLLKAVNSYGSPSSKRSKSGMDIAENAKYCYLLTGTPMTSKAVDLYNTFKMLKSDIVDFNKKAYNSFYNYVSKYSIVHKSHFGTSFSGVINAEELHEKLNEVMVRRTKSTVLPFLKKQRQFIPLDTKLSKEYKDIEYRLKFPKPDDSFLGLTMTGRKLLSELKTKDVINFAETLLESGEQLVVTTAFKETINILKTHFKNKACVIDGSVNFEDREKAIEDFQSKKKQICILNMAAGGVGLTLTSASNMIMIDYDWSPINNIQVEDRICRTGQTKPCSIYYMYHNNSILDKVFVEMNTLKSSDVCNVIDNIENNYDLEQLREISNTPIGELLRTFNLGLKEAKQKEAKLNKKSKKEVIKEI